MDFNRTVHRGLTEAEWLALRAADLTSTEISAVFGVSPYETVFELYHRKAGRLSSSFEATERTEAGQYLEPAIAALIAHREGLQVDDLKGVYVRIDSERIGASFDYQILGGAGVPEEFADLGPGPLEIKNVDWRIFADTWDRHAEPLQAPIHIELQLQWQCLLAGYQWGAIGVLIGGNDPRITYRRSDPKVQTKLLEGARDFWSALAEGREPSPDYQRDGEALKRLFTRPDPRLALADTALEPAMEAVAAYVAAREAETAAGADKEAAAAWVMDLMRETDEAALPNGSRITWRADKRGRRTLRVTGPKQEAAPAALAAE